MKIHPFLAGAVQGIAMWIFLGIVFFVTETWFDWIVSHIIVVPLVWIVGAILLFAYPIHVLVKKRPGDALAAFLITLIFGFIGIVILNSMATPIEWFM